MNQNKTQKKILVIVGGGTKHISSFKEEGDALGIDVVCASYSDLEYTTEGKKVKMTVKGEPLDDFNVVYIRLVGNRFEEAALLVNYCRERGIRLSDRTYERTDLIRIPIPKSIEAKLLIEGGINMPETYFGTLKNIKKRGPELFGFPFVIKGTTGKQGHAVWSPRNEKELEEIVAELTPQEKKMKKKFIAQRFLEASQRSRVFVVGGKAVAGITRPTRWRKRFLEKKGDEYPEGIREALDPIPEDQAKIAIDACEVLGIDVGGVDVLKVDKTGELYILEVNSAPRWASVRKDTGLNVERAILEYLMTL